MKIDAHYYAVLAFCRACGFNKESAYKVAYASQFVDDAIINHIIIQGDLPENIDHEVIDNQPSFFNMATCHSYTRIKTFNYSAMINNTTAFHFVPGCKGKNFPIKLRCIKESPVIMDIFKEALDQDDLIKLGIVLHAYADTFSHQGFSGLLSKVNDIKEVKTLSKVPWTWTDKISKYLKWFGKDKFDRKFDSLMPAYGHGQAMEYPDFPFLTWSYAYDYSDQFSSAYKPSGRISNKKRFVEAFKGITRHLVVYIKNHQQYQHGNIDFDNWDILFNTLLVEKNDEERIKKWQETLLSEKFLDDTDPELTYCEDSWLKEAFINFDEKKFHQRKVEGAQLAPNFSDVNWYKYYLAVKWYKERFFHYCTQHDLDING